MSPASGATGQLSFLHITPPPSPAVLNLLTAAVFLFLFFPSDYCKVSKSQTHLVSLSEDGEEHSGFYLGEERRTKRRINKIVRVFKRLLASSGVTVQVAGLRPFNLTRAAL